MLFVEGPFVELLFALFAFVRAFFERFYFSGTSRFLYIYLQRRFAVNVSNFRFGFVVFFRFRSVIRDDSKMNEKLILLSSCKIKLI